jgi:hypothetical protein
MNTFPTVTLRSLRLPLALAGLVTVLATAFAWPTSHLEPRDVPIGLSGSPGFVSRTTAALNSHDPGAFDITVAPDDAAGRQMLRDNEIYGLFDESGTTSRLLLASAGRPAVAQLLTGVETEMSQGRSSSAVTEEVSSPADDPRSAVFTSAALPTVLGAIAAGVILGLTKRSRLDRLLSVALVAAVSGLALTLVLNTWLGALSGDWWTLAGCYALGVGAIISAINGLSNVFGRVGLIATAATVMLLGNPLSGATSAPELLPRGWSALGQVLPPGALATSLRDIAFYDGNGASSPVLALAAWAMVGTLLLVAGPATSLRRRRRHIAITITREPSAGEVTHEDDEHTHVARLV